MILTLRKRLIRLAHENREIRPHLLSVLKEAGYSLTDRGLEPTQKGIHIQPDTILYYGASSSPSEIIVTSVSDDMVLFKINNRRGGFTDTRESRWIFEDLAIKGSKTWLKTYGSYWPEQAKSIKNLLAGKPGKKINVRQYIDDMKKVTVEVEPTKAPSSYPRGDAWYGAEEYGGVGGRYVDKAQTEMVYTINTDKGRLKKLKRDNRFKVLSVKPGR